MRIIESPKRTMYFRYATHHGGKFIFVLVENNNYNPMAFYTEDGNLIRLPETEYRKFYPSYVILKDRGPCIQWVKDGSWIEEGDYYTPEKHVVMDLTGKTTESKKAPKNLNYWNDNYNANGDRYFVDFGYNIEDKKMGPPETFIEILGPTAYMALMKPVEKGKRIAELNMMTWIYNRSDRSLMSFDVGHEVLGVSLSQDELTLCVIGKRRCSIIDLD